MKKTIFFFLFSFFTFISFFGIINRPENNSTIEYEKLKFNENNQAFIIQKLKLNNKIIEQELIFSGIAYTFSNSKGVYTEKAFYRNGYKDGLYLSFHDNENGQLSTKCYYSKNKKNGEFISYDKDGKLILKALYKNGELYKKIAGN